MGNEMKVIVFIHSDRLNEKIVNNLIPNEKIFLDVKSKYIKLTIDNQDEKFETKDILNITENDEYYIELVNAKLNWYHLPYNTKDKYGYNGIIVQLYLSKEKRNLECKNYNVGKFKDEVPYQYLTKNDTYKKLYDLSICNTKKIVNENRFLYKEYSGTQKYKYLRDREDATMNDFFESYKDKYYNYKKSNKIISIDDFNSSDYYIRRLNDRLNNISDNIESLLKHKDNLNNYFFVHSDEEKILIELADVEYDYRKVFCDQGWTGNIEIDELVYYMTYINMHVLNGVIFSKELIVNDIGCFLKTDPLGQYVCIDNEYSLNYFKKKYNIIDDDFKIGKYVIIFPRNLESYAKEYLEKYISGILAMGKKEDLLKAYESFTNEMCKELTKTTMLHELGHMAFTGSERKAKPESDESAANWFSTIGLNVVEKYRIYLETRIQPKEYQDFFTNTALLPGGKLFESKEDIESTLMVYKKKNNDDIIKYKNECNYEYYKKVRDMLDDMYIKEEQ